MSSISKEKGHKYYKYHYRHPITGKWTRVSMRVATRAAAQKIKPLYDERVEMLRLGKINGDDIFNFSSNVKTVAELVRDFGDYLDSPACSIGDTKKRIHLGHLKRFAKDWGNYRVNQITKILIEDEIIEDLRREGKSDGYIHEILKTYQRAFTFATRDRRYRAAVETNPFFGMLPKSKEKKVPRFFESWEMIQILDYFNRPEAPEWARHYFPILLCCGDRPGKLLDLTWCNVFLEEKRIKLYGKKRWRYFSLDDPTTPEENRIILDCLTRAARHRKLKDDRVFWMAKNYEAVKSQWRRAKKYWENSRDHIVIDAALYDFRRSYACWYLMRGGDFYDLFARMGWEDWRSARPYIQFVSKSEKEQVLSTGKNMAKDFGS